ncbi:unnamed protein product [Amoebophrya sp. A25]|nr:unnamed protein product [Amoebophrya sp. A25]|eukprot:GSA25T00012530001.1
MSVLSSEGEKIASSVDDVSIAVPDRTVSDSADGGQPAAEAAECSAILAPEEASIIVKSMSRENLSTEVQEIRESSPLGKIHVEKALKRFKELFYGTTGSQEDENAETSAEMKNNRGEENRKIDCAAFCKLYRELLKASFSDVVVEVDAEGKNEDSKRVFRVLDKDKNGELDAMELCTGLSMFCAGTPEEKIKAVFDFVDENGDGVVSRAEMFAFLYSYFVVIVTPEMLEKLNGALKCLTETSSLQEHQEENEEEEKQKGEKNHEQKQKEESQSPTSEVDNEEQPSSATGDVEEVKEQQVLQPYTVEGLARETMDSCFAQAEVDAEGNLSVEEFTRWFLAMQAGIDQAAEEGEKAVEEGQN